MNGREIKGGGRRRLSPLGATVLILLGFALEVVAWLWILGPPEALPPAGIVRVSVHLPPPLALPAAASAAPAVEPAPRAAAQPAQSAPATPETTAAPEATASPAPPAAPEAPAGAEETPAPAAPAPASAAAPAATAAPPAAPPLPEPAPGAKPAGKTARAPEPQLALVPAPAPGLVERNRLGPLPKVAPDGRAPWRVYARPFDKSDSRPRVAVVIGNLGFSSAATEAAIQELPGGVTLAFSPYAHGLSDYIPLARAAGHEVLLSLPMEDEEGEAAHAGPQTLLTKVSTSENLVRLGWLLSRFTGYVGATNYLGARFTSEEADMRPILEELKARGLLFLDSGSGSASVAARIASQLDLPAASAGHIIDREASRDAIDGNLDAVEEEARAKGASIAIGFPYPVTIERVAAWTATLEQKGISLAPVSAMVHARSRS